MTVNDNYDCIVVILIIFTFTFMHLADNMFDSCFYLVLMPISAASTIKQLINYPYLIKNKKIPHCLFHSN